MRALLAKLAAMAILYVIDKRHGPEQSYVFGLNSASAIRGKAEGRIFSEFRIYHRNGAMERKSHTMWMTFDHDPSTRYFCDPQPMDMDILSWAEERGIQVTNEIVVAVVPFSRRGMEDIGHESRYDAC